MATKMLAKSTDRHAASYRDQVTSALLNQFARTGIVQEEQDRQLGRFWEAVRVEMIRLAYQGHGTGGAA